MSQLSRKQTPSRIAKQSPLVDLSAYENCSHKKEKGIENSVLK